MQGAQEAAEAGNGDKMNLLFCGTAGGNCSRKGVMAGTSELMLL